MGYVVSKNKQVAMNGKYVTQGQAMPASATRITNTILILSHHAITGFYDDIDSDWRTGTGRCNLGVT